MGTPPRTACLPTRTATFTTRCPASKSWPLPFPFQRAAH
jgi:hypothetical protein